MLQQELLTAEEILPKMFADSAQVVLIESLTTCLDTEGLPEDIPLSTLPVRTNLLIRYISDVSL